MNARNFIWIIVFLIILGTINACTINISNMQTIVRVEGEYFETISAENADQIDLRISFKINNISGSNCANNITTRAKIYRWNNTINDWALFRTTTSKSATLVEDDFVFTWHNEFSISNSYDRYKIEGIVLEGNNELLTKNAFIDVEDNTCSGIVLITENFTIDEGRETTRNFRIENNTNKNFEINDIRIFFTSPLITSGSIDYSSFVGRNSSRNILVRLNAGNVSYDRTISGTFAVSGYLEGTYCSETQIGRKNFETTVRNTGSSYIPTPISECNNLRIVTKNIEINENSSKKEIFYLENNSNKRFEITNVQIIDSGLTIKPHYFEKFIFPGNIGDIILNLQSHNVFQTRAFEQIIRVEGRFSDGRTCSYSSIGDKSFFVTINNRQPTNIVNCQNLLINVPSVIEIKNFGQLDFTITNNTGKTAIINVESDLQVSLGTIALPNNTSISNTINVSSNKNTGQIILRPLVDSCNIASKTIIVNNIARGNIENVVMSATILKEEGKIIKIVFNNPTNKTFLGVLRADLENQIINDRTIAIPSGESFAEIIVDDEKIVKGNISFTTEGQEKKISVDETQLQLTGLFAFGADPTLVGIIFLIIIIAIAILVIVLEPKQRNKEIWETKN